MQVIWDCQECKEYQQQKQNVNSRADQPQHGQLLTSRCLPVLISAPAMAAPDFSPSLSAVLLTAYSTLAWPSTHARSSSSSASSTASHSRAGSLTAAVL